MPEPDNRIMKYLLGELSAEESFQVETEYFRDEDLFESIQALEDQLLRDFVKGEMDSDIRHRFETRYRSSRDLAQKIDFAEAVLAEADRLRSQAGGATSPLPAHGHAITTSLKNLFRLPSSAFQRAAATVALLGFGVGCYEWKRNADLELHLAQLEHDRNALAQENAVLERSLAEKSRVRQPLVASFILVPGISRDQSTANVLSVPAALGEVRLKLPIPQSIKYSSYRVVLQKVPSIQISSEDLSQDALVDSGKAVMLTVPSVSLRPGQYIVFLKGRGERGEHEDVDNYSFTVLR